MKTIAGIMVVTSSAKRRTQDNTNGALQNIIGVLNALITLTALQNVPGAIGTWNVKSAL
jgi:hypothetical protein